MIYCIYSVLHNLQSFLTYQPVKLQTSYNTVAVKIKLYTQLCVSTLIMILGHCGTEQELTRANR